MSKVPPPDASNKRTVRIVLLITGVIFATGCFGMLLPETRSFFIRLTPLIILLSLFLVLLFVESYSAKTILVFLTVAVAGYAIEVAGIKTQLIFGHYRYGNTLGFSLFNTPLLIGINWLFLVYTSASLVNRFALKPAINIVLAALIMVGYDLVMEPVAVRTDMWSWENQHIPLQNYVAWFVTALLFHTLFSRLNIPVRNPVAPWILVFQFIFFLILRIFLT